MSRTLADESTLPRLLRTRKKKRGIILLMVVSLLALFLLMGVTFAVLAIQYKYAADTQAQRLRYMDPPMQEADMVLGQLLYESVTPTSLSGHGFLSDMYGNDYVQYPANFVPINDSNYAVQALTANNQGGGQFLQITFSISYVRAPNGGLSRVPGYYNGRVLTIYAHNIRQWVSTRIAQYVAPTTGGTTASIYVETPVGDLATQPTFQSGAPFVINGAPFNGAGAGFDPTANSLNAVENSFGLPVALLPHYAAYESKLAYAPSNMSTSFDIATGGPDEPYDTPNFQDMRMAFIPPRVVLDSTIYPTIPSFHRPDLLNFWLAHANDATPGVSNGVTYPKTQPDPTTANGRHLLRRIIFRPMPWDNEHPNFTGGNRYLDRSVSSVQTILQRYMAQQGGWSPCWDVDNDGDGISDSIWIDPGLPVMTAPNGRRYKRLAAILIKDLDARANLNVHGNLNYASQQLSRATQAFTNPATLSPPMHLAGTPAAGYYLPRGLGFGPAEIDFCNILGGYGSAGTIYTNILQSRYGSDAVPGVSGDDALSNAKTLDMPRPNGNHTSDLSLYHSSPPDVWGRAAVAMDYFGQPSWLNVGTGEVDDDPYEMQFDYQTARNDQPFGPSDQEHLNRFVDASMVGVPGRLMSVAQNALATTQAGQLVAQDHVRRESLTTMSYHVGGPRTFWKNDGRFGTNSGQLRQGISVLDLYFQRLQSLGGAQFANQWRTIVPFELMHGEAFNINRLFGDGNQDATTLDNFAGHPTSFLGIIDDPSEATYGTDQFPFNSTNYNFEHHNDDPSRPHPVTGGGPEVPPPGELPLNARITYARHLYCMLMLIRSNAGLIDLEDPDTIATPGETARAMAQFAINMVDFRDNDSINTGFEYDADPFGQFGGSVGWDVDGYLSTPDPGAGTFRGVVWGVERPELLITETISFHDRRTENLQVGDMGPPQETTVGATMNPDDDYDQRVRPKGRLFIELFNPWMDRSNNQYDHKPAELYYNGGVRLNATTADDRNNPTGPKRNLPAHPVWRIMLARESATSGYTNPDAPAPQSIETSSPSSIDRTIYFVNPNGVGGRPGLPATMWTGEAPQSRFYPDIPTVADFAPVMPGRYAVVGSSGVVRGNDYVSFVGRTTNGMPEANFQADEPNTRRFILTPNSNANVNQFRVVSNDSPDVNPAQNAPTVAIPINMAGGVPRSLNVSEPINGYESIPGGSWTPMSGVRDEPDEGLFNPAVDTPLDKRRTQAGSGNAIERAEAQYLLSDGTYTGFRTVYLQRLANPLIPWDRTINPYITIDTASLDLTTFNGITVDSAGATADPDNVPVDINFRSFQRGHAFVEGGTETSDGFSPGVPVGAPRFNLWAYHQPHTDTNDVVLNETAPTADHFFPRKIVHSFGFLNLRFGPGFTVGAPNPAPHPAYIGAPTTQSGNATFPWLSFNNRPFISPVEVLHVPAKSQFQLLNGFTVGNGITATNAYTASTDPLFAQLFNFCQTNTSPGSYGAADGPLLGRLFDYIETPAPFVGSERMYNTAFFTSTMSGGLNVPTTNYRPPFNKLSRFRDPGRININSIAEEEVWRSLVDSYTTWSDHTAVFKSRQGYDSTPWGRIDPDYPSIFANPFRPAEAADLMPVVRQAPSGMMPGPVIQDLRARESDATLLRRLAIGTTDANKPLLAATAIGAAAHNDSARSPFMRYQPLQKIANNVSFNSNCYATWITIGYFEVEDNPGGADVAHPDGFRLGQELGLDEGNTQRHRAFYLIDRSIPVGFIPGMKLNSEDCVILRRQIE